MTTTPPGPPPGPAPDAAPDPDQRPRASGRDVRDLARLRRSTTDRHIAGVCGGLARHLDVDPLLVRVVLAVLVFFGGAGLLVYGAIWLLVPEDDGSEAVVSLDDRTRTGALIGAGVFATLALLGDSVGWVHFPWPLVILALVVLIVLARSDRGERTTAPGQAGQSWQQAGWAPPGTPGDQAAGPSYAATPPGASWLPPVPPVPPRRPRKRGPVLFWFTLALAALGIGTLGLLDVAGTEVPDAGYPAIVVAACGVMLLVGAFYGRAGGLSLVGLLATVAMAVSTAADKWPGESLEVAPRSAAELREDYRVDVGGVLVDLSGITDLDALDGRTLQVAADVGKVEVVVPDEGLDIEVVATVDGPGHVVAFGQDRGGIDPGLQGEFDGGLGAPTLVIDARVDVGEIDIHTESGQVRDRLDWRSAR